MEKIVKHACVKADEVGAQKKKPQYMQKIVKSNHVHLSETSFNLNSLLHTQSESDVLINIKKNGDTIEAIEVVCPCGNKIEIVCQYE